MLYLTQHSPPVPKEITLFYIDTRSGCQEQSVTRGKGGGTSGVGLGATQKEAAESRVSTKAVLVRF